MNAELLFSIWLLGLAHGIRFFFLTLILGYTFSFFLYLLPPFYFPFKGSAILGAFLSTIFLGAYLIYKNATKTPVSENNKFVLIFPILIFLFIMLDLPRSFFTNGYNIVLMIVYVAFVLWAKRTFYPQNPISHFSRVLIGMLIALMFELSFAQP